MNPSRHHLERFLRSAAASLPTGARVLDAGAGDCRYAGLFSEHRYESADFAKVEKPYGELTYVCDLASVPVEDGRYDAVTCTQVLAHLPDPRTALRELRRVLRPGGRLYLTAPLFFQENEQPFDFYRYTQFGLRHLLSEASFAIERIEWLEGFGGTLAYQLGTAARVLRARPSDYGGGLLGLLAAGATWASKPLFGGLSLLYGACDRRHRLTTRGMCKNYSVVAIADLPGLTEQAP